MTDRCVDGRLMRHKPFQDDPDFEYDVGECPDCKGGGIQEVYGGHGNVLEVACGYISSVRIEAQTECRRCSVCEGMDHHWMYVGDEINGEPVLSCKHCDAIKPYDDDLDEASP
jgi:hypothetical protein